MSRTLTRMPLIHDDMLAERPHVPTWLDWFRAALLTQYPTDNEQRFDQDRQVRETLHKLPDAHLELGLPHYAHLEADSAAIPGQAVPQPHSAPSIIQRDTALR